MSTTTSNLGLFKYTEGDHNINFDYQLALNDNWDKIDLLVHKETVQNFIILSNGTITLSADKSIYSITPSANTTFTFTLASGTVTASQAFTFELYIDISSSVYSLTFPASVSWQDGQTPDLSATGKYFLVFRTMDNGTTWLGNLQGKW